MIDISMLSNQYIIRRLNDSDTDDILDFCQKNTMYYQYCGAEISKDQVLNDLHITPPGVDIADKYYVGFFNGEEMVAVLDLIDGYPEPAIGYIGFFMMNAALQGKQTRIIRRQTISGRRTVSPSSRKLNAMVGLSLLLRKSSDSAMTRFVSSM